MKEPDLRAKDHLQLSTPRVPETLLLPGDPERVNEIAALWESREVLGEKREYRTLSGRYQGKPIGACSTGIGGPSAEIAAVELFHHGARNLIRVGTSGGLGPAVRPGDLVILSGCVRACGAADAYVPLGYPAVADHEVVQALIDACREMGRPFHLGLGITVDSFYATKPALIQVEGPPLPTVLASELERWSRLGVLQVDMEAAALFVISSILGMKAGAVCTAGSNIPRRERPEPPPSNLPAIEAACRAARLLSERGAAAAGKRPEAGR